MIYSQRSNDPDIQAKIFDITQISSVSNLYLQRIMTGWHSFCMHKDVDPCFWLYSFTVLRLTCSHSLTMLSVSLQLLYGVQRTLYIRKSLFNIQECCCQIFLAKRKLTKLSGNSYYFIMCFCCISFVWFAQISREKIKFIKMSFPVLIIIRLIICMINVTLMVFH